ncbi:MAG: DUF4304 domain-containing protein [Rhodobacteraceae bacterium]|nr:DUF4304 domain-containing protein [Paracoccaceae bacterium]
MTHKEHRQAMETALKSILVPDLRARGFRGSFPHFRRQTDDRVDFLSIQFKRSGGSFCVEIGQTGPDGLTEGPFRDRPVAKLDVTYLKDRLRLGSRPHEGISDHWYVFGPASYDPPAPMSDHDAIARDVVGHVAIDGEAWWDTHARTL